MRLSPRHVLIATLTLFATARLAWSAEQASANDAPRIGTAHSHSVESTHKIWGIHKDERFAMCSTFKFLAAAAVLQRVDRGEEKLDRFVTYTEKDILAYAPIAKQHLAEGGMTIESLCAAAVSYSDNTAGNLILKAVGGPPGLTKFLRSIGDQVTRSDRYEPDLNDFKRDDPRDTTSPVAMLRDMRKLLLGEVLSKESREKLETWMAQNTTGDELIRKAVPPGWKVGDKTGRNHDATNDIAILRGPKDQVILLCVFADMPGSTVEKRAEVIRKMTVEVMPTALKSAN